MTVRPILAEWSKRRGWPNYSVCCEYGHRVSPLLVFDRDHARHLQCTVHITTMYASVLVHPPSAVSTDHPPSVWTIRRQCGPSTFSADHPPSVRTIRHPVRAGRPPSVRAVATDNVYFSACWCKRISSVASKGSLVEFFVGVQI